MTIVYAFHYFDNVIVPLYLRLGRFLVTQQIAIQDHQLARPSWFEQIDARQIYDL
jgi:hypothetical protein